jgi:hypothetical protein
MLNGKMGDLVPSRPPPGEVVGIAGRRRGHAKGDARERVGRAGFNTATR